jgi:hypothetical protein
MRLLDSARSYAGIEQVAIELLYMRGPKRVEMQASQPLADAACSPLVAVIGTWPDRVARRCKPAR